MKKLQEEVRFLLGTAVVLYVAPSHLAAIEGGEERGTQALGVPGYPCCSQIVHRMPDVILSNASDALAVVVTSPYPSSMALLTFLFSGCPKFLFR
jgi:hypothetical protein